MRKSKQYEVLSELYRLNLIDKKLLLGISDNVEDVNSRLTTRKIENNLDFVDEHQPVH